MPRLIRVLSIDGGGVRGIIPAQILVALEGLLKHKTGDENARVADYFDLIAGTSTGGMLTCVFLFPDGQTGRPNFSALEAVELYLNHGPDIFRTDLWHTIATAGGITDEKYPSDGLISVLHHYLGEAWLSDLLKPCLITAYDIRRRRTVFFSQHAARENPSRNFKLTDVVRAATAAPTYFETALIQSQTGVSYPLVDGAVFANNPTLCAYAEGRKMFDVPAGDMAILSLGTGDIHTPLYYEQVANWGMVSWVRPLLDIMMSGISEVNDFVSRQAFDAVGHTNQYLRISPNLKDLPPGMTTDLDDATLTNLRGLREIAIETVEEQGKELSRFADLLIESGA